MGVTSIIKLSKEDFFKVISSVVTIFVLMGIIKASVYYSIFGINILEYAEWNEYLFFFLSDFGDLLNLLTFFFIAFFVVDIIIKLEERDEELFEKYIPIAVVIFFVVFFSAIIIIRFNYFRKLLFKGAVGEIIIYALVICFIVIIAFLINSYEALFEDNDKTDSTTEFLLFQNKFWKPIIILISVVALIFLLNVAPPYLKAYNIINNQQRRKSLEVYSKDKIIMQTRDSIIYVGKTSKFYYFFDLNHKQALIINTTYVDSVKYVRKKMKGVSKYYDPLY